MKKSKKRSHRTKRSRRTTKGYSMTARAGLVMDALMELLPRVGNSSNTWTAKGETYFWDQGREQYDGAMTGSVWMFLPNNMAKKVGTYRIEPNGKITRFPATTKKQKQDAEKNGQKRFTERYES